MYLRTTPRKNKDGSVVRYLQLAHNTWDPLAKRSRAEVIYNFGREDAVSRAALARLIASVSRFLEPDAALAAGSGEGLDFLESRPLAGVIRASAPLNALLPTWIGATPAKSRRR